MNSKVKLRRRCINGVVVDLLDVVMLSSKFPILLHIQRSSDTAADPFWIPWRSGPGGDIDGIGEERGRGATRDDKRQGEEKGWSEGGERG